MTQRGNASSEPWRWHRNYANAATWVATHHLKVTGDQAFKFEDLLAATRDDAKEKFKQMFRDGKVGKPGEPMSAKDYEALIDGMDKEFEKDFFGGWAQASKYAQNMEELKKLREGYPTLKTSEQNVIPEIKTAQKKVWDSQRKIPIAIGAELNIPDITKRMEVSEEERERKVSPPIRKAVEDALTTWRSKPIYRPEGDAGVAWDEAYTDLAKARNEFIDELRKTTSRSRVNTTLDLVEELTT